MAAKKPVEEQEEESIEEVDDYKWVIPNWLTVLQNDDLLSSQTFEFKTCSKYHRFRSNWSFGFKFTDSTKTYFKINWKLISASGFKGDGISFKMSAELLAADATVKWLDVLELTSTKVGSNYEATNKYNRNISTGGWESCVNPNGEFTIKIQITLDLPLVDGILTDMKMVDLRKDSIENLSTNFGALLKDEDSADLKIVTSDEKKFSVHKLILKAQCPVFECMFRSDLSETKTGTVKVKDINGKTMELVLHYFYTGEVLPSWRDPDTVVEFTYAAEKYQMTSVLSFLDEVLGIRDEEDASYVDVLLLKLTNKLGLKVAEKQLLERIKKTTAKVDSVEEFFQLYDLVD